MKSSKSVRITLVSTLIIIGLFTFCYFYFIRPVYLNNSEQNHSVKLDKHQIIRLGKYPEQKKVFGIELEIKGNARSNVDIFLSDEDGPKHTAAVKGKNLDFVYKNDWYGDSCIVEIVPRGTKGGKVDVSCRFLARD